MIRHRDTKQNEMRREEMWYTQERPGEARSRRDSLNYKEMTIIFVS